MGSVIVCVTFTKNNTIYILTNFDGDVLYSLSLGNHKRKGAKKLGSSLSSSITLFFIKRISKFNYNTIHIKLKGFNKTKRTVLKIFKRWLPETESIFDITAIPHNGCRLRKRRRL